MEITIFILLIVTLFLYYKLYRSTKIQMAMRYTMLDLLLDPQKQHHARHDLLRPLSSSGFSGKLAVLDANKFLDDFSVKHVEQIDDPMDTQAQLLDSVMNTYD